jgi:hypothetical protein
LGLPEDFAVRHAREARKAHLFGACALGALFAGGWMFFTGMASAFDVQQPDGYNPIDKHITPDMCAALPAHRTQGQHDRPGCLADLDYQTKKHAANLLMLGALGGLAPLLLHITVYAVRDFSAHRAEKRPPDVVLHGAFQSFVQAQSAETLKTAISAALGRGDMPTVERLLQDHPSFPWHDPANGSVLEYAITATWPAEAVATLIQLGALPTAHELDLAIERSPQSVFDELLSGKHVRAQREQIAAAVSSGDPGKLAKLLASLSEQERATAVNIRFDDGDTLLCIAAQQPKATDLLQHLLDSGARVNDACVERGLTALHWAVTERRPESVRLLLDSGASPSIDDTQGNSAIDLAAYATSLIKAMLLG